MQKGATLLRMNGSFKADSSALAGWFKGCARTLSRTTTTTMMTMMANFVHDDLYDVSIVPVYE